MFILEQKWGNDGYSFWFKLLEILGSSDGHYICLGNPSTREFLVAKTHLEVDLCYRILDLLAELEAIDRDLWETEKVIWCQNLVDNVGGVYQKRRADLPQKPSFRNQKPRTSDVSGAETPHSKVSDAETPQSKVKESKGEYSRAEESIVNTLDASPSEREILNLLKAIPNYPFDLSKDLPLLRDLIVDFPDIDLKAEIRSLETWLIDRPLDPGNKKTNARSRLRNWIQKASEFKGSKTYTPKQEATLKEKFQEFWREYPRTEGELDAWSAFKAVFPPELGGEKCGKRFYNIGKWVGYYQTLVEADANEKQYVPLPAKFLRRENFDKSIPPELPEKYREYEFVEVENG